MASHTFTQESQDAAYGLLDTEIAGETSFQSGDDELLDPVGYGAKVRATLADFRDDRPDLFHGLGMDDALVAQVRYNPIANYVEMPLAKADAKKESVSAFIVYFWAHTADQDMNRLHFYYAR